MTQLAEGAENTTEENLNNATVDLLNLNIWTFQNLSEKLIAPKTLSIWQQYLEVVFRNIDFEFKAHEHIVLTSWPDIYYIQQAILYILNMPKDELELYIWWSAVEEFIMHTTVDFRKLHNDYAKTLTQLEGNTPRSLYCTSVINQLMGMAVSYAIAQPDFLRVKKPKVLSMIQNIRMAFNHLVEEAVWMDRETKCSTLEKSHLMKHFIGFPEWILKSGELDKYYGTINFNQTTHIKNLIYILHWGMTKKLNRLNKTEDIGWATIPTNVNAFHTFQANAISKTVINYHIGNLKSIMLN